MKRILSVLAAAVVLFALSGATSGFASTTNASSKSRVDEVTGCLEPGPVAKEYIVEASNGTKWGIQEDRDLMLNDYVGETVTVTGDPERVSASEKMADGASRHIVGRDLVVEAQSCQK